MNSLPAAAATREPVDYTPSNFMPGAAQHVFRWADIELDKVTEMVSRKEIHGSDQSLVQTYLKQGALIPAHSHPRTQWIYVLQGALQVSLLGETVTVREGEVLHVPAGTEHQAEALDDTFVLDLR
jgi:quercetin dioxygenase-like cupin family protein